MTNPSHQMTAYAWFLFAILSVIWGSSFFANAIALQELPPFTVVAFRVFIGALTILCFLKITGIPMPRGKRLWLSFLLLGFLNNALPFGLMATGQTMISSSLASIINATTPIFTLVIAHIFTHDEKLSAPKIIGIMTGISGVAIIFYPGLTFDGEFGLWGELMLIGTSIAYGCSGVFARKFTNLGLKPGQIAFGQLAAATLYMMPLAIFWDGLFTLPIPSVPTILAVASLAMISSAVAYLLYYQVLKIAGATNSSLVTLTVPIVASILGVTILGEDFLVEHGVGMALILTGLIIVDGRLLRKFRKQQPPTPI